MRHAHWAIIWAAVSVGGCRAATPPEPVSPSASDDTLTVVETFDVAEARRDCCPDSTGDAADVSAAEVSVAEELPAPDVVADVPSPPDTADLPDTAFDEDTVFVVDVFDVLGSDAEPMDAIDDLAEVVDLIAATDVEAAVDVPDPLASEAQPAEVSDILNGDDPGAATPDSTAMDIADASPSIDSGPIAWCEPTLIVGESPPGVARVLFPKPIFKPSPPEAPLVGVEWKVDYLSPVVREPNGEVLPLLTTQLPYGTGDYIYALPPWDTSFGGIHVVNTNAVYVMTNYGLYSTKGITTGTSEKGWFSDFATWACNTDFGCPADPADGPALHVLIPIAATTGPDDETVAIMR